MTEVASASLADRLTGRVTLRNISWRTYTSLLDEIGDDATRLTYNHGMLEIEMPSRHHEQLKRFVGEIVEICLRSSSVDYEPAGNATWRQENQLQGLEADECYHIQHAAQVRGKKELDLSTDPPPDLAIEIELTSPSLDKLHIYYTLGVPEIWRIRPDGTCQMLLRRDGGEYQPIDVSVCVPQLTPAIVTRYILLREKVGHSQALRQFEADLVKAR